MNLSNSKTKKLSNNYVEVNFDGLIGPNHNYAGLAFGNLASEKNAQQASYPKKAALEGLEKMRKLIKLGFKQGFMLPQNRPDISTLKKLGFNGSDTNIIKQVAQQAPQLLSMVYSASSMWAANAATVSPSCDSTDGKVHFTPANLQSSNHRAIEHTQTQKCLSTIFNNENYFTVHDALPSLPAFSDEGAANHSRLCDHYGQRGIGLFVYGRDHKSDLSTFKFPARQTLLASQAIVRQHNLGDSHTVYLQQNPTAINAGAFHNDVVAVANGPVLFYHQDAFEANSQKHAFEILKHTIKFKTIEVPREQVNLQDAIQSYLFNSQLLAHSDGSFDEMTLIAPTECRDNKSVYAYLNKLIQDKGQPIQHIEYVDVRQSMANGGGPACLRLRVVLNQEELAAVNPIFLLDAKKIDALQTCINKHYPEQIYPQDLAKPELMRQCQNALKALSEVLGLEGFYES